MIAIKLYHKKTCNEINIKMPFVPTNGDKIYLGNLFKDFGEDEKHQMATVQRVEYDITNQEINVWVTTSY